VVADWLPINKSTVKSVVKSPVGSPGAPLQRLQAAAGKFHRSVGETQLCGVERLTLTVDS